MELHHHPITKKEVSPYYPYDGKIRSVPGVFVDRATGARVKAGAASGARARLALPARVRRVSSRNLIGVIPGASDELMLLHCHTDGTNGVEDNGPNAIVAMSQYLARLPRGALPRTIMVLLTTGHFHGAAGTAEFVRRHHNGLLRRCAALRTWVDLHPREQPARQRLLRCIARRESCSCQRASPVRRRDRKPRRKRLARRRH